MFGINKDRVIHFIGIGGIGMSGIARVLINLGYEVTGSDINESATTKNIEQLGGKVFIGHNKTNVENANIIVHSSAIDPKNPEIIQAKNNNIPIIRRAEMLAELMRLKYGIAVAGTHGKTTTTSIVATIMNGAKKDPTYIIGGIVSNLKTHGKLGSGELLIAEADESDGTFLLLNPILNVITNIDWDHMDFYGNKENLMGSFVKFANKIPFYGMNIINIDDQNLASIIPTLKKPYKTISILEEADYVATDIEYTKSGATFNVKYGEKTYVDFKVAIIGEHNLLNTLGAIAVSHQYGLSFDEIKIGLKDFTGVARRLEFIGNINEKPVLDDYGHHPTEVSKTISALNKTYQNVTVFFEPHRYSRTKNCWKEFLHSFNNAKDVYILPSDYPAGEKEILSINSQALVHDINQLHPNKAKFINYEQVKEIMNSSESNIFLASGAGPISRKFREILND